MLDLLKIILLLVVFQFPSNLFSHGGGLNSEGCHNDVWGALMFGEH